jgi:glutamate formiminotransferase
MTFACVVNVSEGCNTQTLARLSDSCGPTLLDRHRDAHHNRSVFTLAGPDEILENATRALARVAVTELDVTAHGGAHPRFGVIDVVPFVPLVRSPTVDPASIRLAVEPPLGGAMGARDRFARWAGEELLVPSFLYGPLGPSTHRTLPEVRRDAFGQLGPDFGPRVPHPSAGAVAVGARHFLVAYNLWVEGGDVALARSVASAVRSPAVRALGFDLGGRAQVSCNLVHPRTIGPLEIYDQVAALLAAAGAGVERCELVGLLPAAVLADVPEHRWAQLALGPEMTLEARMESVGVVAD